MELAMKCMTKSIYPDILFVSKKEVDDETVVYPMGCRAFLSEYLENGKNKVVGRGNLGVTSINLPRIAIKNKGDEKGFYEELDRVLELCKENSLFRIDYLKGLKAKNAPILWESGALLEEKPETEIYDTNIFHNVYMTISLGYIGLSEVSQLLWGKDFSQDKEIYEKSKKVIQHLRDKVEEWKEETGIGFALYSTPSEGLCNTFCRKDVKEFGQVKGITEKGYYDNSFHVSSRIYVPWMEKLKLEAPFHKIASAGHISYIETDSLQNNVDAVYDVLKYAKSVGIHYMGINQPVDNCFDCGFHGEFLATEDGFTCPQCGNHDSARMNVIRRVN